MSSSEVGAPTSDSSVTEEVKEASTESTTKPDQKDDNSSEASPKKVWYSFGKVDSFGELTRLNIF